MTEPTFPVFFDWKANLNAHSHATHGRRPARRLRLAQSRPVCLSCSRGDLYARHHTPALRDAAAFQHRPLDAPGTRRSGLGPGADATIGGDGRSTTPARELLRGGERVDLMAPIDGDAVVAGRLPIWGNRCQETCWRLAGA